MKCYWHPDKTASYMVNLGDPIDLDTPACKICAAAIEKMRQNRPDSKATVRLLTDREMEQNDKYS